MPYIYKITNTVNQKVYIGKTMHSINKRWKEHCRDYKKEKLQRPIYVAMRKYGIENFQIEQLEEVPNEKLNEREKFWIEYYSSFKNGYNATLGGDGKPFLNYDLIVETYKNIGNIKDTAIMLGISTDSVHSVLKLKKENIRTQQEIICEKFGKIVNMFQKDGSYVTTFSSAYDAARFLISNNLTNCKLTTIKHHIVEVCKGRRRSAANYKWEYA